MEPFINCKYEAIYNVLKNFNKNTDFLNLLYYFELQEEKDILKVNPKSKINFKDFLKLFKIQETSITKTQNLKKYLQDNLKNGNCVVIKSDLYYQKFSNKYFKKIHKKHNVFIKNIIEENVTIIENEFADSDIYIEMVIDISEIEQWYGGYISNYYDTKIDTEDTLYLYEINNDIYLDYHDFKKVFQKEIYITTIKNNLKKMIKYSKSNHNRTSELQTYTNILNYKMKELSRIKKFNFKAAQEVLFQQINILNQIRKLIIKDKSKLGKITKFIDFEEELIHILKFENGQEKLELVLRSKDKYKIIKNINDINTICKYIYDVHIYKMNKFILEISDREKKQDLNDIVFSELANFVCESYIEHKKAINTAEKELIKELEYNGYNVGHINVQCNSINGYTKDNKKEKFFFKILSLEEAKEELKGYFLIYGKLKVSDIYKIIRYENFSIIMFEYDENIQKDKGLLNDFLVENDFNKSFNNEHYEVIHKVINESLKCIKDNILKEIYPMQKFFNERINKRLLIWYREDIYIEFNNKKYKMSDFINEIKNYFEKNRKLKCFLSQGDPNALNLGTEPILFDYATSGYNAIIAEFSTIFWSILFNDLYYAPKYHKNSYRNHEKIMKNLELYNLNINYNIVNKNINIISGKIKTTKIRKNFMKEYIKKLKDNKIIIHKNCVYFIMMRILCIFNLNEMEDKDKAYSILIMISIFEKLKKLNEENVLSDIERFIDNLEEF